MQSSNRKLSREARQRMGDSGRRNLESWHARAQQAGVSIVAEIDQFRADVLRELGPSPSTSRRALAESAIMTYGCICLVNSELRKVRHKDRLSLVERASWTTGQLLRLLKALDLDAKPRPRTLADVFPSKVAATGANPASDGPVSAGKSA